jgi:hypothetical protein
MEDTTKRSRTSDAIDIHPYFPNEAVSEEFQHRVSQVAWAEAGSFQES